MAWNVNQIYQSILFLLRKNQAGGVSSTDLFYSWNIEQRMYHQDLVGRWQARGAGKSGINTGLIQNETVLTELAPFTKKTTLVIAGGNSNKPADFIYRLALRINGKKVDFINSDQIASVNDSVIDPPSIPNNAYYATEYQGYYTFLPTSVTLAELDYICDVVDIVWGYTLDGNNRQVYNPATSVQPQWLNNDIITITKRVLTNFGVSFKDKDFENFGRIAQNTGD